MVDDLFTNSNNVASPTISKLLKPRTNSLSFSNDRTNTDSDWTSIVIKIEKIGLKEATQYLDPFITVHKFGIYIYFINTI